LFFGFRRKLKKNKIINIFSHEVILRMAKSESKKPRKAKKGYKMLKDKEQDKQLVTLSRKVKALTSNRREFSSALSYTATTLIGPNSAGSGVTYSNIGLSQLAIAQGDTQITREGNQLRIAKWKMKLIISCSQSQFNLTNFDNNLCFRIVIARPKQGEITGLSTIINSELYQNGSGVTYAKNQQEFLYRPLNTDSFDIKFDKVIKLLPLTTGDNTHNIDTNLPSKKQYTLDLAKWFPKVIKYAGTSTTPEVRSYGIFIACGVPDGFIATSTPYSSSYAPQANFEMFHTLRFDA